MKNKDYSNILIYAALLVTVFRYVGAFVASDVGKIDGIVSIALSVFMGLSGLGMGFLDVLGTAYVFDGWRRVLPKSGDKWSSRFQVLTGFVAGLFLVGLAILTPFTVARVRGEGMAQVLGDADWLWALAVNVAPVLIIGGVTFSQSGFVGVQAHASTLQASSTHDTSTPKSTMHKCKHCDAEFASLPELASHSRWTHPKKIVVERLHDDKVPASNGVNVKK